MLGSITPLGERGRGQPYVVTMLFFLLGSIAAGAGVGAALGALGGLFPDHASVALIVLGGVVALGLAFDSGLLRRRLPSVRRQVDETWLLRYRGWVYGLGFGFQLGLGFATIVTLSAVYAALAAALLSGSVAAGLAIGCVFGVVRWACAAAGAVVQGPADLARAASVISRLDRPTRRLALGAQFVALIVVVATLAA